MGRLNSSPTMAKISHFIPSLFLIGALTVSLASQCQTVLVPGEPLPGLDYFAYASHLWDRDGAGPQPPVVVIGGSFSVAGNLFTRSVATWDAASGIWSPLDQGLLGGVRCFTTMANGDLVAGGAIAIPGSSTNVNIARWDGASWTPLGGGIGGTSIGMVEVRAVATLPNGDIVAGGDFTLAGGVPVMHVARWDGIAWHAMGTLTAPSQGGPSVNALAVMPNGDLIAGGNFDSIGGTAATHVARWDGSSWSSIGTLNGIVVGLSVTPTGALLVGGAFTQINSVSRLRVALWNGGTSWSGFPSGPSGIVNTATMLPNGNVVAGGSFSFAGGGLVNSITLWNGAAWQAMGTGSTGTVMSTLVLPNGEILVCGLFTAMNNVPARACARWNGAAWASLSPGINPTIYALAAMPNGDLVVGGDFTQFHGLNANFIVRWNGTSWSTLSQGVNGPVRALFAMPNGDLIAGGDFAGASGVLVHSIARWNGTAWSALGSGTGGSVTEIAMLPNGNLVAAGSSSIPGSSLYGGVARWNGSAWAAIGPTTMQLTTYSLAVTPDGRIFIRNSLYLVPQQWTGSQWSLVGAQGQYVNADNVYAMPNGDLLASGGFDSVGGSPAAGIARWDGTSWSGMGSPVGTYAFKMTSLPNGDLCVVTNDASTHRISRFDGLTWSTMNTIDYSAFLTRGIVVTNRGDVVVCADFTVVNGVVTCGLARFATNCPAMSFVQGSGCSSSGGSNSLAQVSPAWVGASFRSRGAGLPSSSIVLAVTGFGSLTVPLAAIFPEGQPGCDLLVTPDALNVVTNNVGTADYQLAVPNASALAGMVFYHQMVPFEVDAQLSFLAVTATNALEVTVGAF